MSETSPRLNLPYIQPSQAQKHVTHNEAVELLDLTVQMTLKGTEAIVPPTNPQEGEMWGVGDNASAAWLGQNGNVAAWYNAGWLFVTPQEGWLAWDSSVGKFTTFDGTAWVALSTKLVLQNLDFFGVNTSGDANNPLSVVGPASLFSHLGNGHQLKVNKATEAETASILLQSGFTGHAEIGLNGNNGLSVKVSNDGSSWLNAISISEITGQTQITQTLNLAPQSEPSSAASGDIYFDSATSKLRCFDGAIWHDLF